MHPGRFRNFAGRTVDSAIGEHVGDIDGVLGPVGNDADTAGQRQLADDQLLGGAGLGIDLLDSVVGHVGDEDAILVVDREVVERWLELRHHFLRTRFRVDPHQLTERGIHHPQIALGIEIDGGRNLEAVGDHRQLGLVDIDLGDLALEPQRAVQHVVRAEFEAVEAAHFLHDHARRLNALDVNLIKRVAEEHGCRVESAVLAVRERVDPGQAGGELLDRAVALAGAADGIGSILREFHIADFSDCWFAARRRCRRHRIPAPCRRGCSSWHRGDRALSRSSPSAVPRASGRAAA